MTITSPLPSNDNGTRMSPSHKSNHNNKMSLLYIQFLLRDEVKRVIMSGGDENELSWISLPTRS